MIRFLRRSRIIFVLILLSIGLGIYIGYRFWSSPKQEKAAWIVPNVSNPSKKFVSKDTIIDQINRKQELITLEVEMSEKVVIDDSWGTLSIFKKLQNITFGGNGIYSVDLSKLVKDNIELQANVKRILVKIPEPIIKSVNIDEQKTIYETTEKGLLRFGEIKLTPAENQVMIKNAKEKMTEKMTGDELHSQALKSTEDIVKDLVKTIIKNETDESYEVIIEFQK